jgi:hypothetical protein
MAKKDRREIRPGSEGLSKKEPTPGQLAVFFIGKTVDRLGVPFAVLLVLLGAIWKMGSETTRNDFIREVLFGDITRTRHLSAFFAILIIVIVGGAIGTRQKGRKDESAEMKRVSKEKTVLQERLLGRSLSNSAEPETMKESSQEMAEDGKRTIHDRDTHSNRCDPRFLSHHRMAFHDGTLGQVEAVCSPR